MTMTPDMSIPAADELLKRFGLTSLVRLLPGVLEQARQQQWAYETFLQQALQQALLVEEAGRAERAYQRRLPAAPASGTRAGEQVVDQLRFLLSAHGLPTAA